jgi:uncharacterized repeat protein (TIGR01451 family)
MSPYKAFSRQSSRYRLMFLLGCSLVALLVVALAVGALTVYAFGDLVVTFTTEPPDTTKAGTSHSFTVEVANQGTTDPPAEAVVFEYRAPAGVVVTDIKSDVGECEVGTEGDPNDPSICSLGNIADEPVTVDITVYVLPDVPDGTLLDHDVRAWQFGTEEAPPDNENHAFVEVEAEADLGVEKTSEGDVVTGFDTNTFQDILTPTENEVTAGELLKYIVTVTNNGPSDAQDVVVTDTLPAKVDFLYSVGADCWANAANPLFITCPLNTVPATTTQQLELVVRTRPDAAIDDPDDGDNVRDAVNNVGVTSTTDDPEDENNIADVTTRVNAVANLQVTKTDDPDPVLAGEEVKYIITARNLGPSKAREIDIVDTLPNGLVFVRCEPVDPDEVPVCAVAGQVVTLIDFRINGLLRDDLMPDEERSYSIVAYARSNLVKEPNLYDEPDAVGNLVTIEDTVEIAQAGDITDWYVANNTDHELTGVTSAADLSVRKTDTPVPTPDDGYLTYDPVTNSFVYTYYITVENLGPSDAGRVIVTDTLPVYASLDGAPASAIVAPQALDVRFRDDGVVIVDFGQIAGNDGRRVEGQGNPSLPVTRTLTIRVRVDANVAPDIGFLENRVEVRTVRGDVCPTQLGTPVCPNPWPHGYTPTPDPNPDNNVYVEYTALVAPEVKVDKKAYVRRSPARGIDRTTDGLTEAERCAAYGADDILVLPGDEVTYCYLITNEGDSWLHSITLRDTPTTIVRTPTTDFTVVDPSQPPLRGTIAVAGVGEAQTITIATVEPEKAVLAPKGVPDDYDHILIIRSFTVDFPGGGTEFLGSNTARVDAVPSTKYSTPLPGIEPSGDCEDPNLVCDTDLLHDTLALPVLEDTTKDWIIYDDHDLDELPGPGDTIQYVVDIPNTGIIEATGVTFFDPLFNYIADNPNDARVPGLLVAGSVAAQLRVYGQDPVSGRIVDAALEPPDLAFGQSLTLLPGWTSDGTAVPGIVLTYNAGQVLNIATPGGDSVQVSLQPGLVLPPKGRLVRFDGVTYNPPIEVIFTLHVTYQVRIKDTVPVDTIVLNHGWVDYNEIDLFDQRFPQFNPLDVWQFFATNRRANNHDGTPGRAYQNVEFPGWPEIPAGVEPTNFEGPRFNDYALPGRPVRDDDDPTWFKVEREAPSIGADTRIQLPVLRYIGRDSDDVDALIEVQNVGGKPTEAVLYLWAEYSGFCPPQEPGPFKTECTGLLEPGSSWTWRASELPASAYSGILVSYDTDVYTCYDFEAGPDPWGTIWGPNAYFGGQPLAVHVVRTAPGSRDPGVNMSGAYEGFSRAMEGVRDPAVGGFQYYVPNVYSLFDGFTSWLYVQNSGDRCTSVEIWLRERDQCIRPSVCRISKLSPGETYALDVAAECGLGGGFEGSATLRSSQPLGTVVDNVGPDVLLTSRGVPADIDYGQDFNGPDPFFTAGSFVNYGPLIYREYQGWDSQVWVQNLSSIFSAKVKVYFLDNSGDIITTIVDWVCPRGSQKFFLPVISGLPGHYVGAVRVESQAYWSPGDPPVDSPRIMSVAELLKYEGPARAEVLEGIAYNLFGEDEAYDWQIGEIETWGVRRIAIPSLTNRAGGYTTELAIQNVVANPGFTDFALYFYDQNGLIDYVCEKLNQKQVEYVAINTWGFIAPHFEGSAVISATRWTHAGNNPTGRSVGLAAVAVERVGTVLSQDIPGDESSGVQGFPIHRPFRFLRAFEPPACPGQP